MLIFSVLFQIGQMPEGVRKGKKKRKGNRQKVGGERVYIPAIGGPCTNIENFQCSCTGYLPLWLLEASAVASVARGGLAGARGGW